MPTSLNMVLENRKRSILVVLTCTIRICSLKILNKLRFPVSPHTEQVLQIFSKFCRIRTGDQETEVLIQVCSAVWSCAREYNFLCQALVLCIYNSHTLATTNHSCIPVHMPSAQKMCCIWINILEGHWQCMVYYYIIYILLQTSYYCFTIICH